MKNLLIIIVISIVCFTGCKKKTFDIDPTTQLAVNGSTTKAIPTAPYPMDTILTYAFETHFLLDAYIKPGKHGALKHDLVNKKFWFGDANSVVEKDSKGNIKLGILVNNNLRDVVVTASRRKDNNNVWVDAIGYFDRNEIIQPAYIYDTIAYIPNRVVKAAESQIHEAFAAEDYDRCLQLFETAYVFTPITGAEWRALKAKNEH